MDEDKAAWPRWMTPAANAVEMCVPFISDWTAWRSVAETRTADYCLTCGGQSYVGDGGYVACPACGETATNP